MADQNVYDKSGEDLALRLKCGDPSAFNLVAEQFGPRLVRFVRRRLPHEIRALVDAEDVVQEVFRSIVLRVASGDFPCDTEERLWMILRIRATKRVRGELRKHHAARRDVRNQIGISTDLSERTGPRWEPIDPRAGPEITIEVRDKLAALADRLDLRDQVILYLRLDGYTEGELADLMHVSLRTIERALERVRHAALQAEEAGKM